MFPNTNILRTNRILKRILSSPYMASRTKFDSKKKRGKGEQVNEKVYLHRFFDSIDLEARSFQNPRIESIVSTGWKKDRSGLGHCPHPPTTYFDSPCRRRPGSLTAEVDGSPSTLEKEDTFDFFLSVQQLPPT